MKKIAVIGSGFAGLAAASILAHKGFSVALVEKNQTLGGRARSFQAEGLKFDMGPSWYWMPEVFQDFFALFGKRVSDYYQLEQLDPSFAICFGEGDTVQIPAAKEDLLGLFEQLEPGSSVQLVRFLDEAARKYEVGMKRMVYKPGRSLLELADWQLFRNLFRMHLFQSFDIYVRKFFKNSKLIRILEFPVLFLGGMPANTPALYSMMNHAELCLGTWYPMGGMHKIIEAMAALARSLGVEIFTGMSISRIEVDGGVARGLRADDRFIAADAVIAAADYHHVEQHLLAPEYRRYDEAYWDSRVMAPSSLVFYLGVARKIDSLQHHTLFFDEDFDVHTRELYERPQWPSRPLFYLCCPSRTDPSVAPAEAENLFVLIPVAPGLEEDEGIADTYFDMVMKRLEALTGESIRDHVFFERRYSVSNFSEDYNAYKGNAYGLANTLRQTALLKPALTSKKVENLFFAGQLTLPGPGVPPSLISGQVAARQALKYLGGSCS